MAGRIWIPGGGGGADLDVVTAEAPHVLAGKVIVDKDGNPLTGTMPNQGAKTAALNCGGSYAIPAGYHNGNGKVTANSLASQTDGDATAAQILTGKIAWVDGVKVTGTMANKGAVVKTITPSASAQSYTVPAGYHNGSGKVSVPAVSNLSAANIKKGVTVGGVTGTWEGYVTSPLYLLNGSNTWLNLQTTGVTCTVFPSWFENCDYNSRGSSRNENDTYICLGCQGTPSSTSSGIVICRLNQTINLTDYKYIKWDTTLWIHDPGTITGYLGVSTSPNVTSISSLSAVYSKSLTQSEFSTITNDQVMISNVSSISGNYYIYFALNMNLTGSGRTVSISGNKLYLTNS